MSSEVERLRREVQSLTDRLGKVKLRPKKRKGGTPSVPAASSAQAGTSGGGRRRRRKVAVPATMAANGEVVVSRSELITLVQLSASQASVAGQFDLFPSSFKWLANLWKSFERVKWMSCSVRWVPAVGTTYGGLISYGVDWTFQKNQIKRDAISALTPSKAHALWVDSSSAPLVLPQRMLQSRLWYVDGAESADKGPGRVCYCVDGTSTAGTQTVGEFWVTYRVCLSGTRD